MSGIEITRRELTAAVALPLNLRRGALDAIPCP